GSDLCGFVESAGMVRPGFPQGSACETLSMSREFWHDLVTEKSWRILQDIRQQFSFVLIGGWAVFLYTRTLKSKDIDIVVDYDILGRIRDVYALSKNDRLKKYEIRLDEVDVDIYVPHLSNPGLPREIILSNALSKEGFRLPPLEELLLMKENAGNERQGSTKGEKDGLDLLSLLKSESIDWPRYLALAKRHNPDSPRRLKGFLETTSDALPIGLNRHQLSRLKKIWLSHLGNR